MNLRRFHLRINRADIEPLGCYYFGSGHIEIRKDLRDWLFITTVLHELVHWLLDCFRASYYSQLRFDVWSNRWFPTGKYAQKHQQRDLKILAELRAANYHRQHIHDLINEPQFWEIINPTRTL